MNDDFNTPILIATLFDAVKFINQIKDGSATITAADLKVLKLSLKTFTFDILGLSPTAKANAEGDLLANAIEILITLRKEARINKDFALSDKIRDDLAKAGIQLNDSREGTTFTTN